RGDGRGAGRSVLRAGRLRRALLAVRHCDSSPGSGGKTWRARLRGRQRRHQGMARRAGPDLLDGPLHRLPEVARTDFRPGLRLLRALSLRALPRRVEPPWYAWRLMIQAVAAKGSSPVRLRW